MLDELEPISGMPLHDRREHGAVDFIVAAKLRRPCAIVLSPVVELRRECAELVESLMAHKGDADAVVIFVRDKHGHVTQLTVEAARVG